MRGPLDGPASVEICGLTVGAICMEGRLRGRGESGGEQRIDPRHHLRDGTWEATLARRLRMKTALIQLTRLWLNYRAVPNALQRPRK